MQHNMQKIAKKVKEIGDYCQENDHLSFDELCTEVNKMVEGLNYHAQEMGVPLSISAYEIVTRYKDDPYEEESSYYEEYEDSDY